MIAASVATILSICSPFTACAIEASPRARRSKSAGRDARTAVHQRSAGTYHYWATTTGCVAFRGSDDTQLSGAFIVDAKGAAGDDRVFVITEWTSFSGTSSEHLRAGRSWRHVPEKRPTCCSRSTGGLASHRTLAYRLAERVRGAS